MVAKGFESAATKEELRGVEQKLTEVEYRLTEKIDGVEQKVNKVDNRVDEVYEILARFEEGDILDLQKRIKILERAVKALSRQVS